LVLNIDKKRINSINNMIKMYESRLLLLLKIINRMI
jgi:hypothetical protein